MESPKPDERRAASQILEKALELDAGRVSYIKEKASSEKVMRLALELLEYAEEYLEIEDDEDFGIIDIPLDCSFDFGEYRLQRKLGEGGMGSVYLAEQKGTIKRQVALKIIRPEEMNEFSLSYFKYEQQSQASLSHPNIAKVFDFGVESGRPYFTMEFIKGKSLLEYCDEKKMSIKERLLLFLQVCDAISHAHQKAIVHRDIKSSNILVTDYSGVPTVKVIDFGIAKNIGMSSSDKTFATQNALGSPFYMSPEQADPDSEVDTISDIYSLGVLLYKLLIDEFPVDFDRVSWRHIPKKRLSEVIRDQDTMRLTKKLEQQKEDQVAGIAEKRNVDKKKLLKELKGNLEWITQKALQKQPRERYTSVMAFKYDIQNHLQDEPVVAAPPKLHTELARFYRRNKVATRVFIFVCIGLFFGMTGLYMGYRYAENENERLQRFARLNADLVIRSKSDFNDFVELLFNGRHGDFTLSATYIPFFDEKYFTNAQSRRKTLRKWIKSTDAGKKNILLDIGHNYISRTRGVSSISGPLQKDMKESKLRAYYYEEDYKKIFKSDPKLAINLLGKSTDYEFDALTSQFQHWSDKRKTLTRLMCDIGRCEDGLYMVDQLETLTKVLVSTDAKLKVYNEVICYKSELNRIRGSIYLEMGDYENAQRVLNNALTSLMICKRSNDFEEILQNEEVEVCKLKIQAYVAQGNLKRSISYVKRISEVDEALGTVYESIIELLSGKEKKALERFTLMIEKGDHDHLISALENVQAYSKQKQMLDKAMKHVRLEIKRRKI